MNRRLTLMTMTLFAGCGSADYGPDDIVNSFATTLVTDRSLLPDSCARVGEFRSTASSENLEAETIRFTRTARELGAHYAVTDLEVWKSGGVPRYAEFFVCPE
jgi:hypothetical protein